MLDVVLQSASPQAADPNLLVGNAERDDAAVYDLGDGSCVISTTDFFMPIVDDAFDFGRIASVNAISDVYAMGGRPLMAIAILGWPADKLPAELANRVLEGGRSACRDAGIPLAGGHSIDNPEPIFGLAVTGRVAKKHLKKNGGARSGDVLFVTKPIGTGILTTAQKRCLATDEEIEVAVQAMSALNTIGATLGEIDAVHAMTDVTGFGLLGHLYEMCDASDVSATLRLEAIPRLASTAVDAYIQQGCTPGGTRRNWDAYGEHVAPLSDHARALLCDPQTSGGLLVAVDPGAAQQVADLLATSGLPHQPIGRIEARGATAITVTE